MGGFIQELFQGTLYKRTQGRGARKTTFFVIIIVLAYAALRFKVAGALPGDEIVRTWISAGGFILFAWVGFRLINWPKFADFLIAVEAEMKKVSWPTKDELRRASIIVIAVMVIMAVSIALFDMAFIQICSILNIT